MPQSQLTLAQGGAVLAEVRIPSACHEAVRFAAEELRDYVEKMSGARLPVVEAALPENTLLVAPPEAAPEAFPKPALEHDGYALVPLDGALLLRGARPRSVLFAAYDVLRALGCRWFELGEDGEVVPRIETPSLPLIERVETPRFAMRGLVHGAYPLLTDWMAKNRMNTSIVYGMRLADIEYDGGMDALRRRDMTAEFGHHDFKRYFIDPATYLADYPEWFGLHGGKRVGGYRGVCLCLTNREMEEQFAENVAALLDKYPWVERVSVWPDDGLILCECEACRRDYSDGRNVNDHILGFTNRIAARFPGKRFSHLVYQKTLRCFPLVERPLPNVDFCAIESNPAILRAWRSILDHDRPEGGRSDRVLYIYGYWGGFTGVVAQTRHYPSELTQRIDDFEAGEVDGMLTQACYGYPTGYCTNMLVMASQGWRGHPQATDVVHDYCERGFGEWSGLMRDYLEAIDGLHGSIFREVSPGYSMAKGFEDAPQRTRAIILGELRKLLRVYGRFAPSFEAIPRETGSPGVPDRLVRERLGFDYTHAAIAVYEQALTAVDLLCRAREFGQDDMRAFRAIVEAADVALRDAARRMDEVERLRVEVVDRFGQVDKMTADYFGTSAVLLSGQVQQIDGFRRNPLLADAGLVSVHEFTANELKVAEGADGEWAVEALAAEVAGHAGGPRQFVYRPGGAGAVEVELPVERPGEHSVTLTAFRESRMGRWRILVDGREGVEVDFRHMAFQSREVYVGTYDLSGPTCRVRFERAAPPAAEGAVDVINPVDTAPGAGGSGDAPNPNWLALNEITLTWHRG